MNKKNHKEHFEYNERELKILANAIESACHSVGCDLRCIDWMSYNPDFYRKQESIKVA
jgi:hypothetical protein